MTEDIYQNFPQGKDDRHPKGGICHRVITGTLGLLCVVLLTIVIVPAMRLTLCASERDLLQTNLKILQNNVSVWLSGLERRLREGWMLYNVSLYYISTEKGSWDEAKEDCQKKAAHLVIINNRNEQEFLANKQKEFWIGLTDKDKEGDWKWVDGTVLTTQFWDELQPTNDGGNEHCAETRPRAYITNWNDVPCSTPNIWVCEKSNTLANV
ncbi:hepatic lectin-like [Sardina pilchardus]|uniref:hepatic lectin-like n=1 Tax=Sardina pilchardus TaxID=27697 RepID=UPI002E13EC80